MGRFVLQQLSSAEALGPLDYSAAGVSPEAFQGILNSSVGRSTWGKYSSAMNTFACFEAASCHTFSWPLSVETCRAFVVWCHTNRGLQPTTIKAYLSGIKFVHTLRGMPNTHISDDQVLSLLLKGVAHNPTIKKPNTRRVVTFPILRILGHRIAHTSWSSLTKQVLWAASTTAFFASARMGELLAKQEFMHAPDSDLTWLDVKETSPTTILIRLKQPKSGEEAEFVDLFPFPGFNCCPVASLRSLKKKQMEAGVFVDNLPVFRFETGKNLTQAQFNATLAQLLADMCTPGENSISCHSFRAGIPSTLSLFPHLATSDMVKGWGRWQSDCYLRYQRLKLPQKEKIFSSISQALHETINQPA